MKKTIILFFIFFSSLCYGQENYLLAERYYRDGAYEKATQLFKVLSDKNPFNTTYLKRLISSYQETSQFETVDKLLKERLIKYPTHSYLYVELGYNYEKQQQKEIAKTYYDKAIISIKTNTGMGGFIGRLFNDNALLEYAILAYEETMRYNENANYEFQIAQIYGEKGDFEKMFTSYIDLIDKNENYLNTVQQFTSRYITDDPLNNNNILFKKALIKKSVSNPKDVWNRLLSWLFIQQKEYEKALIQEKALFNRNPEYIVNIINLGYNAYNNNAFDTAKKCFDFILEKSPFIDQILTANLYSVKIAIATNQENIDSLFDAIFTRYGKKSTTLKIQLEYAEYLTFKKNEPEQAIAILTNAMEIAKSKFQKAAIKLKLGDVHVFIGNYNRALIYFSQVQTSIKNHPLAQEARFKVAQTSYFKNDFKWAFAQLKVLKASTTQLIANDALDLFLIISDNQPKDSLDLGLQLYAKADLLAYQNKNTQAIDTLQKVITAYKGQKIEDEALFKQASLYTKTKQFQKAIDSYTYIIALDKEGIFVDDSLYQIAEIYYNQLNNTEKASEYYQKIIFEHPSSIYLVDARKKYRKLRGDTIN
ncbi:tetratricopeptide repeat protein [Polaribacter gochangensis]|uniref:tetratricopeptide repeat protein n=1 Tax=Polaribacter gochangensis TaxID=3252903 RepID=UPI003904D5DB